MHWRILPLLMLFIATAHFNRLSMAVAGAEQIIPAETLSAKQMGVVYSAFLVVYTLCMIPGGWFIDRCGPRNAWLLVAVGSAFFVAGTGLLGLFVHFPPLLFIALVVVRGAMGVVSAPLHPTGARLVANWTPHHATDFVNGSINAAACIGIAFTYLGFGELIDHFGWPVAFLITGSATFALALAWAVFGADHPPGVAPQERGPRAISSRDFRSVLTDPSLLSLTLSYGLLGYFQYLFFYWAEFYFSDQLHLSTDESRWSTSLLTLAMGAGMFVGGAVCDHVRRRFSGWGSFAAVPMATLVLAGTATFSGLAVTRSSAVVTCFAIAMAAAGMCEGAYWSMAVRLGRRLGGTAAAVMNTGGNALGLIAPALTPWISELFGWHASLLLAAIVCWIAALAWLGVRVTGDPVPSDAITAEPGSLS
jgi:MFS family permease